MKEHLPLLGKKVLFVGIGFYDYDEAIIAKLEELGASVSYFCSCYKDVYYKILYRLGATNRGKDYLQKLRKKEVINLRDDNDYVFVIKGEELSQEDIDILKKKNPNGNFILYFWDDVARIKNKDILLKNFHEIWSFDYADCKAYGFKFRPLFYRDELSPATKDYFLSFIGWCHSNRLDIIRDMANQLEKIKQPYFLKLYIGKSSYISNRYLTHTLKKSDEKIIVTTPISYSKTASILSHSMWILDIPHSSQNGLTIRTLEALKCGCHILTSNKSISMYQDISKEYYTIFDADLPISISTLPSQFFSVPNLSPRYSLESFLREILSV